MVTELLTSLLLRTALRESETSSRGRTQKQMVDLWVRRSTVVYTPLAMRMQQSKVHDSAQHSALERPPANPYAHICPSMSQDRVARRVFATPWRVSRLLSSVTQCRHESRRAGCWMIEHGTFHEPDNGPASSHTGSQLFKSTPKELHLLEVLIKAHLGALLSGSRVRLPGVEPYHKRVLSAASCSRGNTATVPPHEALSFLSASKLVHNVFSVCTFGIRIPRNRIPCFADGLTSLSCLVEPSKARRDGPTVGYTSSDDTQRAEGFVYR
ncbi:hypothetical protein PM082_021113 [Marasmius tenuissimus]|nr:hypothetical protein PM082_021113 [Marasmius tenuissimus]